jgi:hypothetical protein
LAIVDFGSILCLLPFPLIAEDRSPAARANQFDRAFSPWGARPTAQMNNLSARLMIVAPCTRRGRYSVAKLMAEHGDTNEHEFAPPFFAPPAAASFPCRSPFVRRLQDARHCPS